jgi:uncharacterized protein with PIN domain
MEEKKRYTCPQCDRVFTKTQNRDFHFQRIHNTVRTKVKQSYACPQCAAVFTRKPNRDRHVVRLHTNANLVHTCTLCGLVFNSVSNLKKHRNEHEPTTGFVLLESAFRKTCTLYRKVYLEKMKTLEQSFANDLKDIKTLLEHELLKKRTIKASIIFHAEFLRPLDHDLSNLHPYVVCLRSSAKQLMSSKDISEFAQQARITAQERIDDFLSHGSGWMLDEIICTDIQIGACPPLNGSCGLLSIKHLKTMKKLNTLSTNNKNQCFYEAVAFHFTKKRKQKVLDNFIDKHINKINNLPVNVKDIHKFENINQHLKCSINVLYAEENDVYPIYSSKNFKAENCINLLLYKVLIDEEIIDHYLYVEDIDVFLRREYRGTANKISYERCFYCPNCLQKFSKKNLMQNHQEACMNNRAQNVKLPKEGDTMKFIQFNNKFPASFIGFFDFEASQKTPKFACETCQTSGNEECLHKTVIEAVQEPITYSAIIVETATNKVVDMQTYTGVDCASHLIDHLLSLEKMLLEEMTKFPEYKFTKREKRIIENTPICHICEKEFFEGEEKVGDHCHTTGILFGAAHNTCNLQRRVRKNIPMFCHNLQGYDSHFIVSCLKSDDRIKQVKGLSYNTEKFRTLTLNSFVFLDSLSFLSGSLNELVNNLAQNKDHKYIILDQLNLYGKNENEKKELLIRKGVYPYESVTGIEMLIKTKKLPPANDFYSSLTDSTVSPADYEHAKKVYKEFKCANLLEYTELYCATDVGLLAEVMIQFRDVTQSEFKLDCCHYVSAPQLAFDGMLKMTKVEIELLTDIDQILFLEQNIRGEYKRK